MKLQKRTMPRRITLRRTSAPHLRRGIYTVATVHWIISATPERGANWPGPQNRLKLSRNSRKKPKGRPTDPRTPFDPGVEQEGEISGHPRRRGAGRVTAARPGCIPGTIEVFRRSEEVTGNSRDGTLLERRASQSAPVVFSRAPVAPKVRNAPCGRDSLVRTRNFKISILKSVSPFSSSRPDFIVAG